ncbi:dual specificity mitogen-activated protein kinase kinase 5-related [Anaeramoeba flamelloides]|uniref:Dual specificity mitogen-activated protein kinase kinase 5-related n=1 Tax=Anaeramoeba flamelloides TaxID=1746091 RepID=A0AAV7ZDV9_9EUKA|nr:dual specificity mitogen-activated protein kinase kinase 5-related [Anaeramoeba flamelloides]
MRSEANQSEPNWTFRTICRVVTWTGFLLSSRGSPIFGKTTYLLQKQQDSLVIDSHDLNTIKRIREDGSMSTSEIASHDYHLSSAPIGRHSNGLSGETFYDLTTAARTREKKTNSNRLQIKKQKEDLRIHLLLENFQNEYSIVDPLLYSSFFSGSKHDLITSYSIGDAVDSYTVLLAGTTNSPDFPQKNGLSIVADPDGSDLIAWIARFDINGNILFSTYFGGSVAQRRNSETKQRIVQPTKTTSDYLSNYWIVGTTTTEDLPITVNSFNRATFNVQEISFIICLSNNGASIEYSSMFGQCEDHTTRLMSIESLSSLEATYILIGGSTNSSAELYKNEIQTKNESITTLFAYIGFLRIYSDRTELLFGSVFGGSNSDVIENSVVFYESKTDIAIWITGTTHSSDFFENYNQTISKNVSIYYNEFKGDNTMGYYLRILLSNIDDNDHIQCRLTSASFLGDVYPDRSHWIEIDHTQSFWKYGYYRGPILIVGDTLNYDTFSHDTIKPDWMKNTANEGNSLVGWLVFTNHNGTSLEHTFLVGCENGRTSLNFALFHWIDSVFISGYTNCSKNEIKISDQLWDESIMDQFDSKYFAMNLNRTIIRQDINQINYDDVIFYSTFVDGVSDEESLDKYAAVKTDLDGNIYSVFNIINYQNYPNNMFTENAFMTKTRGTSSIIIRVYGGENCNPGSYYDQETLICTFCGAGSYSDQFGSTECQSCPKNTYQKYIGCTSCTECPADTFATGGQTSCNKHDSPNQLSPFIHSIQHDSFVIAWEYNEEGYQYQLSLERPTGKNLIFLIPKPDIINKNGNDQFFDFTLQGLPPATRLYIRIRGRNVETDTFGSWSPRLMNNTYGPPFPVHFSNIYEEQHPYSISLNWTESIDYSSGNVKYQINWKNAEIDNSNYQHITVNQPNYEIPNLVSDSIYTIRIIPINDAGDGFASIPRNFSTKSDVPLQVIIKSHSSSTDSVTLEWDTPDNQGKQITGYEYYIKSSDDDGYNKYEQFDVCNEYTIKELKRNTNYSITINAINGNGRSKDNFGIYQTNDDKEGSKLSVYFAIIFGSIGGTAIIIGGVFWVSRSKIIAKKKIKKIKSQIKQHTNDFKLMFKEKLYCTEETLSFNHIDIENSLENSRKEIINKQIISLKKNWIVNQQDCKYGLLFCKIVQYNEMRIYKKLWKVYSKNPTLFPTIQFVGKIPIKNDQLDLLEKNNFTGNNKKNKKKSKKRMDKKKLIEMDDSQEEEELQNLTLDNKNEKLKNNLYLISLEWLPINLRQYNRYRKKLQCPFTLKEKLWISFHLINSLHTLHKNQIIHRDIKPQNILIGMDGYFRIIDFSSAVELTDGKTSFSDKFVGTENFFDPDLKPSLDHSDGISNYTYTCSHDIYSLGKTIETLNWVNKINDEDLDVNDQKKETQLKAHLLDKEKRKKEINLELSLKFNDFVEMCLSPRNERFSAYQLIEFLSPSAVHFISGQ